MRSRLIRRPSRPVFKVNPPRARSLTTSVGFYPLATRAVLELPSRAPVRPPRARRSPRRWLSPLAEAGLPYAAWRLARAMSSCLCVVAMARPRRRAPARWDTEPRAGAFAGHRPARRSPGDARVNDSLGRRKPSPDTIGVKSCGLIASGPRMPSGVAAGAEGASRIGPGLGRVATMSPVISTTSDTAGPPASCLQARFTISATSDWGC